ncbi:shikimate dehydrogenase [Chitinimonas sp. BJB300]|uniref:shikimate dehydrogenase n=1 Tax=Chitinimonas sp. BJB300 TaxID=1559339 RepID=UPI000C0E7529|nr:shikimate dehydrogenase [Chitinimonas sp. BJB300]PHV11399.1 shikimate dehydrogenase [Chitinimonas sp. BJB300]TSJ90997.1 shikimate dehydrogenase [Chitinimonas sp. BJB300]
MTDRYAVIGNPIKHSKSPLIHAAFAAQTKQKLIYERLEAPLDSFIERAAEFLAMGGSGCNVTVPFKEEAFRFANILTERAELAGAVNTLWLDDEGVVGDNTDGAGLVRDLQRHLKLVGLRILLLGAGGAARGVLGPLLAERPAQLVIANRSPDKAIALATQFIQLGPITACSLAELPNQPFDLIINATSASLAGEALPLPTSICQTDGLAYDMMYGKAETPFLQQAKAAGVVRRLDGLGMLVEQAAEAFFLWRGIRPETETVLVKLRAGL